MIEYFYEYVRKIVLFLIFMSFIQVVIPSNKYKSYINLVFSMLLIFIMINPAITIYKNINKIDFLNIIDNKKFEVKNVINEKEYKNIQDEMTEKFFNENIKKQMKNILPKEYAVKNVSLKIVKDKYEMMIIRDIYLEIAEIESGIHVRTFDEKEKKQDEKNIEKIKKIISNFYNVDIDNIFIKIT